MKVTRKEARKIAQEICEDADMLMCDVDINQMIDQIIKDEENK